MPGFIITAKTYLAILLCIFQLHTSKIIVSALTSIIFLGSFSNVTRTCITLRSRKCSIMRFCLIRYAHCGPFKEPGSFGIPGLIFQAKITKSCTNGGGLNMLISMSSGFYHIHQIFFWWIFHIFSNFTHWTITVSALTSIIFFRSFSNVALIFIALRTRTSSIMEILFH